MIENTVSDSTIASLDRWFSKIENCDIPTKRLATWCLMKGQLTNYVKDGLLSQGMADSYRNRVLEFFPELAKQGS